MATKTLHELSETMRKIDFCTLFTRTEGGALAGRPMSNNGDVEYEGDSYFFTYEEARTVSDIERDENVAMSFRGNEGLLGKPPIFITIEGKAEAIREKAQFEAHYTKDLDRWFEQGTDTPGLVLLKVHASRIHYWDGEEEGELTV
ncbi:pyridoxamine 5'-phosphate oxidase family protein [Parvularcula dongshanensis]|uniref:General stress protein 26 n=1 Tax=Parvularcula dongshanensis TaxID=1173995 RepID=A0A840I3Q7_9PROT|nr:pyridoxamine 5'-phosphate oxidase family protein [Parvularcula dongshanensis]MBB4659499.1 general stress protein 26 [Parvularcula dongshanensis]